MGRFDGVFPAGTVIRDLTGIRIMGAPSAYRHEGKRNRTRYERTKDLNLEPIRA